MILFLKIRRKLRFVLFTALIVLVLYLIIHSLVSVINGSTGDAYGRQVVCEVPPETRIKMSETLDVLVKEVLQTLDITYFLCYDSLWGSLAVKGPLRWHQTIDVCLLNEELVRHEEASLIRAFKRHGLTLTYQSSDGVYLVSPNGSRKPIVRLYLFEETNGNYRRVGWKNRLIPPDNCDLIHCFPTRLIAKPMPTEVFMSLRLPVPHEGIEIQKYLFPDSWWLDTEPEECK